MFKIEAADRQQFYQAIYSKVSAAILTAINIDSKLTSRSRSPQLTSGVGTNFCKSIYIYFVFGCWRSRLPGQPNVTYSFKSLSYFWIYYKKQ